LGIDATAPGSAVEPGYRPSEVVSTELAAPAKADANTGRSLREMYGLTLADKGLIRADDVTIEVVDPRTPAAQAGLQAGDVIQEINGVKITNQQRALTYLRDSVPWGQKLKLQVRRGLPHPYSSHPRLDLYVGSLSPHKAQDIGCTI
jgi:S1-C subfamily serine protease